MWIQWNAGGIHNSELKEMPLDEALGGINEVQWLNPLKHYAIYISFLLLCKKLPQMLHLRTIHIYYLMVCIG